ncbi:MAG: hypothetical protein HOP11_01280 [Saprospiraceae bacterium]|nr:hypothetical protein [Saprospiraceae bacterium]
MKILIVEAGSSKTDWILVSEAQNLLEFKTSGINPTTQSKSNILSVVEIAKQNLRNHDISTINFYGAGCKGVGKTMMLEILQYCFDKTEIVVESDLMAAARSSCNGSEGIVAILGTGSHSCLSDGHIILHEKPSLGFLLGDEGSGNAYGKKLLKAYYYKEMDDELLKKFESDYHFIHENYLSALYSSPKTSFELAQFFPFIIKNKEDAFIQKIIQEGMLEFYNQRLSYYNETSHLPIHIVGNVGIQLQEEYTLFLRQKGFTFVNFNASPIRGLLQYHSKYVRN